MSTLPKALWLEAEWLVRDCLDDVKAGKTTSFPQAVKLKPGEVVVFSWITYPSRAQRDRINASAMKDPRVSGMMDPKAMPFDGKRMFMGGFKMMVDVR